MNKLLLYKKIAALMLLTAFLAQTFSKGLIIADYYTHKAFYVQQCENKATPALKCEGKCQMMKKLHREEKKDQETPCRKMDTKHEIPLSSKCFYTSLQQDVFFLSDTPKAGIDPTAKTADRAFAIFHPPRC